MTRRFVEILEEAAYESHFIFYALAKSFSRDEFFAPEFDKGLYAGPGIYAYCVNSVPLYIGRTTRAIKKRLTDEKSPHSKKVWWEQWNEVMILPMHCAKEQEWLEAFLILANRPPQNIEFNSDILDQLLEITGGDEGSGKPTESPSNLHPG